MWFWGRGVGEKLQRVACREVSLVEIILSGKFTVTSRKLYYIVALIIISYWKKIAGLYHLLKGVISENNRMRFTSLFTSVSQSQLGFLKVWRCKQQIDVYRYFIILSQSAVFYFHI